jgi:predicted nucleic acid-binding protein
MRILLDTNIILRLAHKEHVMHGEALAAIDCLNANGHECVIVPQVLYEYWVVATRPTGNNGLGMSVSQADAAISQSLEFFRLLRDERGIFAYWRDLVTANDVRGKNAHDARLIAAMQRHGLTDLLSFNKADFIRFTTIQTFTPAEVLDGRIPSSQNV